jgi:ATP-binding cassette subfamily B protein
MTSRTATTTTASLRGRYPNRGVFERYASAARSRRAYGAITVLVSHRFSTVRTADLIVVIDAGRIVEIGPHQDLMAREGLYAELYTLQARQYG